MRQSIVSILYIPDGKWLNSSTVTDFPFWLKKHNKAKIIRNRLRINFKIYEGCSIIIDIISSYFSPFFNTKCNEEPFPSIEVKKATKKQGIIKIIVINN